MKGSNTKLQQTLVSNTRGTAHQCLQPHFYASGASGAALPLSHQHAILQGQRIFLPFLFLIPVFEVGGRGSAMLCNDGSDEGRAEVSGRFAWLKCCHTGLCYSLAGSPSAFQAETGC